MRAFADHDEAHCLLPSGARSHLVTLVPATTKQHPLGATFSPALLTHQSLTDFSLLQSPLFLLCWPAGALRPGDHLPDAWAPFLRRRWPFSCGGGGAGAGLYGNNQQNLGPSTAIRNRRRETKACQDSRRSAGKAIGRGYAMRRAPQLISRTAVRLTINRITSFK